PSWVSADTAPARSARETSVNTTRRTFVNYSWFVPLSEAYNHGNLEIGNMRHGRRHADTTVWWLTLSVVAGLLVAALAVLFVQAPPQAAG
ncbi:MAG: hypothetical protein ABIZ05_00495, partial [Pseudonocardiaceae bacterium]